MVPKGSRNIGYELWRAVDDREHRFLIRVGATFIS